MASPDLSRYDDLFKAAGDEWNIDPTLLKAVAAQESQGDARAQSRAGAQGLMQITPDTQRYLGITDPWDPAQSIYGAAKYLNEALDREGTPDKALLYYHGGPGWRDSYGPESRSYVPAVTAHYVAYKPAQQDDTATAPAATPKVTPAPAVSQSQGKPMANDALPSWLPAAPATDGGAATTPAAKVAKPDELPSWLPTAPKTSEGASQSSSAPPAATPVDMILSGEMQGAPIPSFGEAGKRIGEAATQAFITAPSMGTRPGNMSVLTPEAQDWINRNIPLVGPYVINPLGQMVGTGVGAAAALGAGAGQAIYEGAAAAGVPALGRDINILAQTLPVTPESPLAVAAMANRARLEAAGPKYAPGVNPLNPAVVERAEARGAVRNALDGQAVPPASDTGIPGPIGATPTRPASVDLGAPTEAARPQAAGAQATTAPIPDKTPAQRVTDLEKTVQQTAEERAGPQLRDDTQYVQGIPPRLLAGREFRPQHSLDEKVAFAQDPVFRQEVERNRRERNEGMVDLLRGDAQDANALDDAYKAREQVSPAELGVFENEQPTSVDGIVSKIDALLAGPEGKQRAVRNTLQDVRDSLHDADGNPEVLPSQVYGARKNLTDMLKRGVKGTGDIADDVRASKHVLEGLLPDFDKAITDGAPQFQDYLKQWSDLSKPIDQMEFLQQYQTGSKKITDKDGYLIPTKVQKMLDDILQANKARGVNKGKSVTDQQIGNIEAVRNELAAQSLQDRMGGVKGSDTFQQATAATKGGSNVATVLRIMGELGIGIPSGGIANLVLHHGVLPHLARRKEAQAAREIAARKRELLSGPNPSTP